MSIDEAATSLVEGVAGQAIVDVELSCGFNRLAKGAHQAVNFFLRGLRTGDGAGASETGEILAEGMAGNEGMKIILFVEVVGIVIPAAHVGAWSGHSLALSEGLEEAVFVKIEEQLMILVELGAEGPVEELHIGIAEDRELRSDR